MCKGQSYGPWTMSDPCGHGTHTISVSKVHKLGPVDCIWNLKLESSADAHKVSKVTLEDYCDMDADCESAKLNGPAPIEVFPVPCTFAASWNAYVVFKIFRHCVPMQST